MAEEKDTQENIHTLDFKLWSDLAQQDSDSFESMRLAAIEEFIESAPEARKQRLRCLQWRIDQERRLSRSPMGACIRISRMMWETLMGKEGLIEHMHHLSRTDKGENDSIVPSSYQATVIPFKTKH